MIQQRLLAILRGGSPLVDAIFSPNGAYIATAGQGEEARVFSTSPVRLVQQLRHGQKIRAIAFTPDSSTIATGAEDGSIRLWDRQGAGSPTRRSVTTSRSPTWSSRRTEGSSHPRAKTGPFESGTSRRTMLLLSRETPNGLRSAKFSPKLATRDHRARHQDRFARLRRHGRTRGCEARTRRRSDERAVQPRRNDRRHHGPAQCVRVEPRHLEGSATRRSSATWLLFEERPSARTAAHRHVLGRRLRDASGASPTAIFSRRCLVTTTRSPMRSSVLTATSIITSSTDVTARIWAGDGGEFRTVLAGHKEEVVSASFDPSGKMILTASRDGTARLWRPEFEPQLGELGKHVGRANDVAASPDERLAASAGEDGVVPGCSAPEAGSSRPYEPPVEPPLCSSRPMGSGSSRPRTTEASWFGASATGVPSERFARARPFALQP